MRKNILILGHNYATQFIDIYNQYACLFDKHQYAVTIAYLSGEPDQAVHQKTLADEVIFLNVPKKSLRGLKIQAIRQLLRLNSERKFELVVCHRYKPAYVMMWVAQFCKIPRLLFVMHELGSMAMLNRQLLIACLNRQNMLFAGVSNAVRDDMRNSLWCVAKERVITLYNAIDIERTEPKLLSKIAARTALALPAHAFVFGNIARLAPNKDQKNLIHAFSLIKSTCPNAKLIILGNGELESQLKAQVKSYHLETDVIFSGFVADGFRYMRAFDCFVLSSIQEAFGRVLLEAMLAKLPVIATRVHGIPEVIADAGLLIQPRKSAELATAMQKIYTLSYQEREQLGEKAYQHTHLNFSIPAFQKQFWDSFHLLFKES